MAAKTAKTSAENKVLKTENGELRVENAGLRTENAAAKVENAGLRTENAAAKVENAGLRTENAAAKVENAGLRTENAWLKAKLAAKEDGKLEKAVAKLADVTYVRDSLRKECAQANGGYAAGIVSRLAGIVDEIGALKRLHARPEDDKLDRIAGELALITTEPERLEISLQKPRRLRRGHTDCRIGKGYRRAGRLEEPVRPPQHIRHEPVFKAQIPK